MRNTASKARDSVTIRMVMAWIALSAIMLALTRNGPPRLLGVLLLLLTSVLPYYYLVNLRRPKSSTEIVVAALALAYFAWVTFLCVRDHGHPLYAFSEFRTTREIYYCIGYRLGWRPPPSTEPSSYNTMYWNWGLLAAFFAAILLVEALRRVEKRPVRVGLGGSPRPPRLPTPILVVIRGIPAVAALVLAGRFLEHWLVRFLFGGLARSGWFLPVELAAWLALAFSDWRPRRPYWRLSRYAGRVARLIPAGMAGVVISLGGLLWGWRCSVGVATCVLVIMMVYQGSPLSRRRRRILAPLLAMFWGFAISAEIRLPSPYGPPKRLIVLWGPGPTGNPRGPARSPNFVHLSVDQPKGRAVGPPLPVTP
jgi:hypothetical protein